LPELREDAFGYRIDALCLAGQVAEAQRLVSERAVRANGENQAVGGTSNGTQSTFWRWMRETFGIVNENQ
jgi:hypothetical protein